MHQHPRIWKKVGPTAIKHQKQRMFALWVFREVNEVDFKPPAILFQVNEGQDWYIADHKGQ